MSDDSFIREVDEELRSERVQEFWEKYSKLVIGIAVAVILGISGYTYWQYSSAQISAAQGDSFMEAVDLDEKGKHEEALEVLNNLSAEGSETYKSMARLRAASVLAGEGKVADAVKEYDAVAGDERADINLRSIARIKAGLLLVDSGSVAEVTTRVGQLAGPGAPYRASALETLGLAYYKAGDLDNAFKQFEELSKDEATPPAMQQRIAVMLAVIASNGGPVLKK